MFWSTPTHAQHEEVSRLRLRVAALENELRYEKEARERADTRAEQALMLLVRQQEIVLQTPSAPVPEPVLPPPLPPDVQAAIEERAPLGSPEYRHLLREARKRLENGVEAKDVALAVLAGEPVEW